MIDEDFRTSPVFQSFCHGALHASGTVADGASRWNFYRSSRNVLGKQSDPTQFTPPRSHNPGKAYSKAPHTPLALRKNWSSLLSASCLNLSDPLDCGRDTQARGQCLASVVGTHTRQRDR